MTGVIRALVDGILTIAAGAAGGLVVAGSHRLRVGGRRVVALEPGQRIAEPDGREWRIVARSFDVRVGQGPTLSVDLVAGEDPS